MTETPQERAIVSVFVRASLLEADGEENITVTSPARFSIDTRQVDLGYLPKMISVAVELGIKEVHRIAPKPPGSRLVGFHFNAHTYDGEELVRLVHLNTPIDETLTGPELDLAVVKALIDGPVVS